MATSAHCCSVWDTRTFKPRMDRKPSTGSLFTPSPSEFYEIRALLNDKSGGDNIIYLENSMVPPVLSRMFKNEKELTTDHPDY